MIRLVQLVLWVFILIAGAYATLWRAVRRRLERRHTKIVDPRQSWEDCCGDFGG